MSFVTDILTPIIQGLFYFGMVIGVIFFTNRWFNHLNPYWKLDIKYRLFRKKYNPENVKWSMDAFEKGKTYEDVEKFLLMNNYPKKKRNEIVYIVPSVRKELSKGRNNENVRNKRSNEQNQIPEIK